MAPTAPAFYLADASWNEGKAAEAQNYAIQVLQKHPDAEVAKDAMLIKAAAESSLGKTEIAYSTQGARRTRLRLQYAREARLGLMRTANDLGKYDDVVATADKLLSSTAANSSTDVSEIKFMRGASPTTVSATTTRPKPTGRNSQPTPPTSSEPRAPTT